MALLIMLLKFILPLQRNPIKTNDEYGEIPDYLNQKVYKIWTWDSWTI